MRVERYELRQLLPTRIRNFSSPPTFAVGGRQNAKKNALRCVTVFVAFAVFKSDLLARYLRLSGVREATHITTEKHNNLFTCNIAGICDVYAEDQFISVEFCL